MVGWFLIPLVLWVEDLGFEGLEIAGLEIEGLWIEGLSYQTKNIKPTALIMITDIKSFAMNLFNMVI